MSFGSAVSTCFRKYADFNGRAKRSEFWWWYLFTTIVTAIPFIIGAVVLASASSSGQAQGPGLVIAVLLYVLAGLISLALMIPTYAVGCRRLHDRDLSGWLQLLMLVPCASIALIVLWALASKPGDNQYGPAAA